MNILAVLAAAVSSFLLGGLWYSPALFGRHWVAENGGVIEQGHPARVFGVSLVFSLMAAFSFAWWLGPAPSLPTALASGAVAGFGLVAASFGINYQFADRGLLLWMIDGGYHLAQFTLFGVVLGLWH